MRISELSARSGVAIPTIKYYLREGMLHQGEQTAATRAEYDETHLRRLRLIRALLDVGGSPWPRSRRSWPPSRTSRCPCTRCSGLLTGRSARPSSPSPARSGRPPAPRWTRSSRTWAGTCTPTPPPGTSWPRRWSGCASSACPSTWRRTSRWRAGWWRRWRWTASRSTARATPPWRRWCSARSCTAGRSTRCAAWPRSPSRPNAWHADRAAGRRPGRTPARPGRARRSDEPVRPQDPHGADRGGAAPLQRSGR
ncbi:MerR family transcriptional regulator [Nonomuraea thailandensis]